jgi:hypothetical protein
VRTADERYDGMLLRKLVSIYMLPMMVPKHKPQPLFCEELITIRNVMSQQLEAARHETAARMKSFVGQKERELEKLQRQKEQLSKQANEVHPHPHTHPRPNPQL